MPVLRMETELVRGVGNQLQQASAFLHQQVRQLNLSAQTLANGWQGPSAIIFMGEAQSLMQRLNQTANAGDVLSQRLQRKVSEWEFVGSGLGTGGPGGLTLPDFPKPDIPGAIEFPDIATEAIGEEGIYSPGMPPPSVTEAIGEEGIRPGPYPIHPREGFNPDDPATYRTMALGEDGQWPGEKPVFQTLRHPEEGMPPDWRVPDNNLTEAIGEHGEAPGQSFPAISEEGEYRVTMAYPEGGIAPPWEEGKMSFAVYPEEGSQLDPREFITKLAVEEGQATTFAFGEEGQEAPIELNPRDVTTLRLGEEGQMFPEIDDSFTTMAVGEEGQSPPVNPDRWTLKVGEEGEWDLRATTTAVGEEGQSPLDAGDLNPRGGDRS